VHGAEGKESREDPGTAATAAGAAAAAGLISAAHQQTEEDTEKQAAERKAHACKLQLNGVRIGGKQRGSYWKMLVLVPVIGRKKRMVKHIKGVDGASGKLLISKHILQSENDH